MEYIPLDDVTSIISNYSEEDMAYQIYSLKPIDLSIIDEMIEKNKKSSDYMNEKLVWPARENILKELKERLSLNK